MVIGPGVDEIDGMDPSVGPVILSLEPSWAAAGKEAGSWPETACLQNKMLHSILLIFLGEEIFTPRSIPSRGRQSVL